MDRTSVKSVFADDHAANNVTDGFTPAQQQAITAGDGPLAIIAGPGCGKTTVLAARLAHLVRQRGADPSSILVVTFTAEAARRLRHEVGRQLGSSTADLGIHTLHAFGRKIIDTWPGKFGFEHSPTVVHRDEARDLLPRRRLSLAGTWPAFPPSELASAVDRFRLADGAVEEADDPLAALVGAYEDQLRRRDAIDFPAMLAGRCARCRLTPRFGMSCNRLFAGSSSTRRRTSRRVQLALRAAAAG